MDACVVCLWCCVYSRLHYVAYLWIHGSPNDVYNQLLMLYFSLVVVESSLHIIRQSYLLLMNHVISHYYLLYCLLFTSASLQRYKSYDIVLFMIVIGYVLDL